MNRQTRQREAIESALIRADRPLRPAEILELAGPLCPGLGIATVYRQVKQGVEDGRLRLVEIPGSGTLYEVAGKHHHHHFECRSCGRVFEVDGCPGGLKGLTPDGFLLESHEIVLYGLCRDCCGSAA